MSLHTTLVGARIRRIDAPRAGLLCLGIFAKDVRGTLLFCFTEKHPGVGLIASRPHGAAADSLVGKLRKEIEGARILALEAEAPAKLALRLQRGQLETRLTCDFTAARIDLERADAKLCTLTLPNTLAAPRAHVEWPATLDDLAAQGPNLLQDSGAGAVAAEREALGKLLGNAQKRLRRRLGALAEDIQRAELAPALRERAQLVVSQQHQVKRGAQSIRVIDYALDPPAEIEIALDPTRTIKEQVEHWFKQARRFERGAGMARERARATEAELAQMEALRLQLTAAGPEQLHELAAQARKLGVRGIAQHAGNPGERAQLKRRKPYRELRGYRDRPILVGKGAADNDALTREFARPQDLWLHARNVAGAHVVVPLDRNETCPQELLLDAAHLATHFSSARGEPIVEVTYTPKRYVRKPRHSAPGEVRAEQSKVLTLHVDAERLTRLLATELQP